MTMNLLRFTLALFLTNLRSALALRGTFVLQVTFMILNNLAFFVFWWVLFDQVPSVRGFGLPDVMLLFGLSASGFGLAVTVAGGVRHLGRFIDDGALDPLLAQPKPTLLYALGMRSQASGIGDFLSGVGLVWFSGYVTFTKLPLLAFVIVASAAVFVASGVVFFGLAFWLPRSDALARQLWELLITFSLYPEQLFGGVMRLVLFTVLPASFVAHVPARIVRDAGWADVSLLGAAVLGYALFAVWFFGRGLRRYSSGSRFGVFG
jgi:ABC-2 type transport system permease protein